VISRFDFALLPVEMWCVDSLEDLERRFQGLGRSFFDEAASIRLDYSIDWPYHPQKEAFQRLPKEPQDLITAAAIITIRFEIPENRIATPVQQIGMAVPIWSNAPLGQ
jgi:hypothetical protein